MNNSYVDPMFRGETPTSSGNISEIINYYQSLASPGPSEFGPSNYYGLLQASAPTARQPQFYLPIAEKGLGKNYRSAPVDRGIGPGEPTGGTTNVQPAGRTFEAFTPADPSKAQLVNFYTGQKAAAPATTPSGGTSTSGGSGDGGGGDGFGIGSTGGSATGSTSGNVSGVVSDAMNSLNSPLGMLGIMANPALAVTVALAAAAMNSGKGSDSSSSGGSSGTTSGSVGAEGATSTGGTGPGDTAGSGNAAVGGGHGNAAGLGGEGAMGAVSGMGDGSSGGGGDGGGGASGAASGDSGGATSGEGLARGGYIMKYEQGGSIQQQASGLAALGRGNDSMLVHMTPSEVRGLQAMAEQQGERLTTNPRTGLPEAGKLEDYLKKAAPILPFIIPGAGAVLGGLAGQAVASGVIAGFAAPGKGFDFKRGVTTGLMAYGLGSAYNSMNPNAPIGGPAGGGGVGGGTGNVSVGGSGSGATGGTGSVSAGQVDAFAYGDPSAYSSMPTETGAANFQALNPPPTVPTVATNAEVEAGIAGSNQPNNVSTRTATDSAAAGAGASTTTAKVDPSKTKFEQVTGVSPTLALIGGNMAYGAYQAGKEMDMYKQQAAAVREEEERKRRAARQAFENSLGRVQQPVYAAGGGLMALGKGGTTGPTNEPRMVKGAGDGMSDSVPATIEGVQEARLANDEFVIPADVVADIGNGSSSSGAKKLYMMMDRVRKARHGTTEQPPEINARKYMPA